MSAVEQTAPLNRAAPGRPIRLAVFTTHPIQYQAPLFRELATRPELALTVFFGSRHGVDVSLDKGFGATFQWDIPLLEGYEHEFLENVAARPDVARFTGLKLRDVEAALRGRQFDACLVLGWGTLAHLQFMRAARRLSIPLYVRGESNLQRRPGKGTAGVVRSLIWLPLRRVLYASLFRSVAGFFVIGSRNRDFYRHFGVPDRKLHWAPYGVENDRFRMSEPERSSARRRVRNDAAIPEGAVVFVSSGKLLARKRPLDLLEAFARCGDQPVPIHLVYIGEGPERASLESSIARLGLPGRVTITGFVNQRAIPEWYAASDCLVLPSDNLETWGLVVNEAMAAGLAVIVSDEAGCAPDLVREGENGFVYPFGDIGALASRMKSIIRAGAPGRAAMGDASRRIVEDTSFAKFADVLVGELKVSRR